MGLAEFITSFLIGALLLMGYMIARRIEITWKPWAVSKKGSLFTILLRFISRPKIRK